GIWQVRRGGSGGTRKPSEAGGVVRRVESGEGGSALLSPTGALHTGGDGFTFEFQRGGKLIGVGTVGATGDSRMPGMVMPSGMEVRPTGIIGRYDGSAEFGMAGAWQMSVEWDGPAARGSASFEGPVQ